MRRITLLLSALGAAGFWITGLAGVGTGVLLTAGALGFAPVALPASPTSEPDIFEIVLPGNHANSEASPILLQADDLVAPPQYGLIELKRDSAIVGLFQVHQILFVANRSVEGRRTFVIHTSQGTHTVSADRMQPSQNNGPVLFWVGEELAAVVQGNQVLSITDQAMHVDEGGA